MYIKQFHCFIMTNSLQQNFMTKSFGPTFNLVFNHKLDSVVIIRTFYLMSNTLYVIILVMKYGKTLSKCLPSTYVYALASIVNKQH